MRRIRQRLGLMLGLVPVVLLTAACTSPAPKVTSQPRPTSAVKTAPTPRVHEFVSTMYGFRLTLPKDWTGVDAVSAWDGRAVFGLGSPDFADFQESGIDRAFTFGSVQLAMGTTLAAWRATIVRGASDTCVDEHSAKKTTLGGEPALTWTAKCPDLQAVRFAVVHGTRGYVAIFEPHGARTDAADLAVYDPIRRSFHFTN